MKTFINKTIICLAFMLCLSPSLHAKAKQSTSSATGLTQDGLLTEEVYQLSYIEREPDTDEYELSILVSDRFLRIDETDDDSGYIIYDDKEKTIYSVSHIDKSILVIKEYIFSEGSSPVKPYVEYLALSDAPKVSGKPIFNYRAYAKKKALNTPDTEITEITCTEVQLVEGLLPEVTKLLQNYQKVVSGQQVKITNNEINDIQTDCYYIDQIYNLGSYYEKGLPIQEWHSNERFRILTGYDKITINSSRFEIPKNYRRFTIDDVPKRPAK